MVNEKLAEYTNKDGKYRWLQLRYARTERGCNLSRTREFFSANGRESIVERNDRIKRRHCPAVFQRMAGQSIAVPGDISRCQDPS
jgi:hypothetical protein